MLRLKVDTDEAMQALGASIATRARPGLRLFLSGQLAAGKTTFVRGYLRALGHTGAVKSPTFTLVESYELQDREVHHFDLYRLTDPAELEYVGFADYLDPHADCLIEWPSYGVDHLPPPDLFVDIQIEPEGGREVTVTAHTETAERSLRLIRNKK